MFTSTTQIRSEGNLPVTVLDAKLQPHADKAVLEMKRIITPEKYDGIFQKGAENADFKICAIAEANLALSYAVTVLNVETSGTGIVRSKGFDESRSDLLSQNEVERLRIYFKDIAMDLLKPFIPQVESTEEIPADEVRGSNYRLVAL